MKKKTKKKTTKIKAVGFDFDDTLISSEAEKDKVMVDAICEVCGIKKGGIKKGVKKIYESLKGKANRRQKIIIILTKILKKRPTKKQINQADKAFSKGYLNALKVCPLFQCANIVKELRSQVKFIFLLSLEQKKDVKKAADHCGIGKYFDEILGGPKSKLANLKHVLKKHHVKPSETVYVGDMKNDIILSKKLGIKAIGIQKNFSYRKILKKLGADFTFSNLCDVPFKKIINSKN